ncbi:ankyrin repeat domain-containing protein [Armatimonas sp.]|uniref:ankyrin repeat domain-containing protein n=1 Tax=Armatimonas sp. TaxID=1872638 RepID=UPI0037525FC7
MRELGLGWLLSRRKRKRLPAPLDAALIAAIKAGDLEQVRRCLDRGANPNARPGCDASNRAWRFGEGQAAQWGYPTLP